MARITELEAINVMLNAIGEQGMDNMGEVIDYEEAKMAQIVLRQTNKKVSSFGYNYNFEKEYDLTQDVNGEITLPLNNLKVLFEDNRYTERNGKVYDTNTQSYVIGKDLKADIYVELSFEYIPYVAQEYINLKAARIFQQRALGSSELYKITQRDEMEAKDRLMEYDIEVEDYNIISGLNISNRRK